jgi:hypothetical protein
VYKSLDAADQAIKRRISGKINSAYNIQLPDVRSAAFIIDGSALIPA